MKKILLEEILIKKDKKIEFAIITNIENGESCIFEKGKPLVASFEKYKEKINYQFEKKRNGIENKNVVSYLDILTKKTIPGKRVAILGAGGIGFDVAQFYIDFEGHPHQKSVKLALEEMKFFCTQINILGVYKKSEFRKK